LSSRRTETNCLSLGDPSKYHDFVLPRVKVALSRQNQILNDPEQEIMMKNSNGDKVLFLDVDGVLNSTISLKENRYALDEEKLRLLSEIIERTGTKIVLSTTWRLHSNTRALLIDNFQKFGIHHSVVIGMTRELPFAQRTDEIIEWLMRNQNVSSWVAVDDMNLRNLSPSKFKSHFVMTDSETGLTADHAKRIEEILGVLEVTTIKTPGTNSSTKLAEALSKLSPKVASRKRANSIISAGSFQKHFKRMMKNTRC